MNSYEVSYELVSMSFTINIDNIVFADNKVILLLNKTLKHTSPNKL